VRVPSLPSHSTHALRSPKDASRCAHARKVHLTDIAGAGVTVVVSVGALAFVSVAGAGTGAASPETGPSAGGGAVASPLAPVAVGFTESAAGEVAVRSAGAVAAAAGAGGVLA